MNCSYGEAREKNAVPFSLAPSATYHERTETVHAYTDEGWLERRDAIFGKTGQLLLHNRSLAFSAVEAGVGYPTYNMSPINNPVPFPD